MAWPSVTMQRSSASVSELWGGGMSALGMQMVNSSKHLAAACPTDDSNALSSLNFERNSMKNLGTSGGVASRQISNREATTGRPVCGRNASRGRLRFMLDGEVLLHTL